MTRDVDTTYQDPAEGFRGWLAYDGQESPLAAGGCRMQAGLTARRAGRAGGRMTLKQRVLGINVDGAKCGIDYDPRAAGAQAALGRFMEFLSDELRTRFSMGPDMGTKWHELQYLAARAGLPSIKYAIKTAQGLTDTRVLHPHRRGLDDRVGPLTLTQRRAGHALAHAAIAAARAAGVTGTISCAMQGFGNLGLAAACSLAEEGARADRGRRRVRLRGRPERARRAAAMPSHHARRAGAAAAHAGRAAGFRRAFPARRRCADSGRMRGCHGRGAQPTPPPFGAWSWERTAA